MREIIDSQKLNTHISHWSVAAELIVSQREGESERERAKKEKQKIRGGNTMVVMRD